MTSEPHVLFPDLPPELRNEIYSYLSTPGSNSQPLNLQLPLQLKTFICKHTTVQICPIHYGSTGLLALPQDRFLEAREYHSWLLNNALELQVSVHFKGRIHTFTQEHWDKKMERHLRKLGKLHPWLKKVARYNIHVLWDPVDGVLVKSKNNKRSPAGQVPLDMANSLIQLMEPDIKRKQGHVRLALHLAHSLAVQNAMKRCRFGLDAFFATNKDKLQGLSGWTKEVRIAPCAFTSVESHLPNLPASSPFRVLPGTVAAAAPQDQQPLIVVEQGVVTWAACTRGPLVIRRTEKSVAGGGGGGGGMGGMYEYECRGVDEEFPVIQLLAECAERML